MATSMSDGADAGHLDHAGEATAEFGTGKRRAWLGPKSLLIVLIAAGVGLVFLALWTLGANIRNPEPTLPPQVARGGGLDRAPVSA